MNLMRLARFPRVFYRSLSVMTTTPPSNARGAFILIEGLDRTGKTTQCKLLHDYLLSQQIPSRSIRYPNRTSGSGKAINEYLTNQSTQLDDHAIHLLFAANRWESNTSNITGILDGQTIVCDRYSLSGVTFSAAKGMSLSWCAQPEVGLLKPDVIILLTVDPDVQVARGGFGGERYETSEIQTAVRQQFDIMRQNAAKRGEQWNVIDTSQLSIEQVQQKIQEIAMENIQRVKLLPLQYITEL